MDRPPQFTSDATRTLPLGEPSPIQVSEVTPSSANLDWVADIRKELDPDCQYLVYCDDQRPTAVKLSDSWLRIGRSLQSDIRFDDATVSRRHALVVSQTEGGGARLLDNRSLNGVFVNGQRVEWSPLSDGDEITVGRHALYFLDTARVASTAKAVESAANT
jgi:pSer/pThr/pTyr-binding forkhead associated (FHA) protein